MSVLRSKGIHTEKGAFVVWSAQSFGGVWEGFGTAWILRLGSMILHAVSVMLIVVSSRENSVPDLDFL